MDRLVKSNLIIESAFWWFKKCTVNYILLLKILRKIKKSVLLPIFHGYYRYGKSTDSVTWFTTSHLHSSIFFLDNSEFKDSSFIKSYSIAGVPWTFFKILENSFYKEHRRAVAFRQNILTWISFSITTELDSILHVNISHLSVSHLYEWKITHRVHKYF